MSILDGLMYAAAQGKSKPAFGCRQMIDVRNVLKMIM
jgi:hypothetical protein